jgi:regulator of sirC expression with transglutaminase-like and TPR domain
LGAAQDRCCAALILTLALACRAEPPAGPLAEALLAQGGASAGEKNRARRALAAVIGRVEQGFAGDKPAAALARVVFDELGFAREIEDPDLRFMRLPAVLASKRGSCYGLAGLYLALGERLGPTHGFSLSGVLVPGHFFVRLTDSAGSHNLELLRRGEEMSESWYRERYQVPDAPEYLRPLTTAEALAIFDFNVGNDLRRSWRLPEAAAAYARAAAAFPQLAEAHASLGLVRHLQGRLEEALAAYQAAQAANPHLPGLDRNLSVLRGELRGAPSH